MLTMAVVAPTHMSRLSPQAERGWKAFCAANGFSLAALSEALGLMLDEVAKGKRAGIDLDELATRARQISAARRGLG